MLRTTTQSVGTDKPKSAMDAGKSNRTALTFFMPTSPTADQMQPLKMASTPTS